MAKALPLVVSVLLLSFTPAMASDWPQWLGPERNGRSGETGLLKSWPKEGPPVLWRIRSGAGFSGVTVVGTRAVTMVGAGNEEHVICLEAATGKQLWRTRVDNYFKESQGGDGPRSTPIVAGNRVFALSSRGKLHALNLVDGRTVWRRDFAGELGSEAPRWGFTTSPLIDGENVLVEVGAGNGQALAAFRREDGQTVWTSQSDAPSYSSPIILASAGVRQAVFFTAEGPVALAPTTGGLLWRYPWPTPHDVNAATPVFVPPDGLFISSGYDTGAAFLRLQPGGTGVDLVWEERVMKNHMATSILHQGHLFGFDDGTLKCVEAATGTVRWRQRGLGKGTLIYADGHLLILGEQGQLVLAAASVAAYRERGRVQVMGNKCWTVPSLAAGRLYLRDPKQIVCLDLRRPGRALDRGNVVLPRTG